MSTTQATISLRQGLERFKKCFDEHHQTKHMPGDIWSMLIDLCCDTGLAPIELPSNLQKLLAEAKVRDQFGRQTNVYDQYLSNNLLHELNEALKMVA